MRNAAIWGEVNPTRVPKIYPTEGYLKGSITTPLKEDIERAAEVLVKAKRPVMIAGNGVHISKAYSTLKQLAEILGMPVATSYTGKSAFSEIHPLAIGMFGTVGQKLANDVIAAADVLLVAGSSLSPNNTFYESTELIDPSRQAIIQLDIEPRNAGWTYPVQIALIGDLKPVLQRILEIVVEKVDKQPIWATKRIKALQKKKQATGYFKEPELYSDASPILPQRLVNELNEVLPPSTIVTLDAGNNRAWMGHFFRSKEPETVFFAGGLAGMGWGVPAALVAKFLKPDRPVVSVAGDGAFSMMLHVLSTAIQYELSVTFVIMNDSGLGNVRDDSPLKDKPTSVDFPPTDYAKIASAFGCRGVRVEKAEDLRPALKEALNSKHPTVIDVLINRGESILKIVQGPSPPFFAP